MPESIMSQSVVQVSWITTFAGMGRSGQRASAGKLTGGRRQRRDVSNVMSRWTAHWSLRSNRMAPTWRMMASSLAMIPLGK